MNDINIVKIKKLDERAVVPSKGSEWAAGSDLYAVADDDIVISPCETVLIRTGLAMELPVGWAGLIFARSGLATVRGLAPANKVGVIDPDYRGEIMVSIHNHSQESQIIKNGDRIAQMVILPYLSPVFVEADELSDTTRGTGGFGSTGIK